jgi:AcrR family transcriptional regulator
MEPPTRTTPPQTQTPIQTQTHDHRQRILDAAAKVFAESGYRGATTRRIAQDAGVNEVTLFRHFGSKAELIREALSHVGGSGEIAALPEEPCDVQAELTAFCRAHMAHLYGIRLLVRTCMGEGEERPEMVAGAVERPTRLHRELREYFRRLQARGLAAADADVGVAASMLLGSVFSDAMGRDHMPDAFPFSLEEAPARYVTLVLAGLRVRPGRRAQEGGTR